MFSSPSFRLRAVRDSDREFLYDLYSQSRWDFQLVDWPSEAYRKQVTRMQYDAQRTDYWKNYPESEHQVIVRTDTPSPVRAGRVWWVVQDDHVHIVDLNILPKHQSQGLGTALMDHFKEKARTLGAPLRHMVHTDNYSAQQFYRRLGFREVFSPTPSHLKMEWRPETTSAS